ncbi:MAG: hypothetical protein ACREHD_05265, partial [Pirellulales bacterium]
MRFIFKEPVATARCEALVAFLNQWFRDNPPPEPDNYFFHYWGAKVVDPASVVSKAEHMPPELLEPLAASVESAFPEVDHLRLGVSVIGAAAGHDFEWVRVPAGEIALGEKNVRIVDV